MKLNERDLQFDFSGSIFCFRLDIQGTSQPYGMAFVDFVVEDKNRIYLIEVKDPSYASVPPEERTEFAKRLQSRKLINEELTPKARDSYAYLHLMEMDSKPMLFVVVIGLEKIPIDAVHLMTLQERLQMRLRKEADKPWKREYVQSCLVVNVETWNQYFGQYPLIRLTFD